MKMVKPDLAKAPTPAGEFVTTMPISPRGAFGLALLFIAALPLFLLVPEVRQTPALWWSFICVPILLLMWNVGLFTSSLKKGHALTLDIALRKQHWVQAIAHTSIFVYWGYHWRQVYDAYYLIVAQLLFAYAFDMLLCWSQRDTYTLGFGPFPVIFSTNLFLWFRIDWFYFQFLMVAVGFAAKDLIRWEKDGRRVHIFNPSSFALALFSLGLIMTGTSDITWAREIASTQFYPPHMYLFLFLIPMPGQYFFGVTSMTMSAVVTTYLFGLAYFAATGTYYFVDSYIPIAVFLGMHLLFTDPSTAPRTELGRLIFGAAYGLTVVALYELLGVNGLPTYYDKLLQVPLLNLTIQAIDRAARSSWLKGFDPSALGRSLMGRRRNLAYISIWTVVFIVMSAAQGVGDDHKGQWLPFWQQACRDKRQFACDYLEQLHSGFCDRGSGWSCNEYAVLNRDEPDARTWVLKACARGFEPACANVPRMRDGSGKPVSAPPSLADLPIILRGSKGPLGERTPEELYALGCHEGWTSMCAQTGRPSTQ